LQYIFNGVIADYEIRKNIRVISNKEYFEGLEEFVKNVIQIVKQIGLSIPFEYLEPKIDNSRRKSINNYHYSSLIIERRTDFQKKVLE
jgi:hypothetical protein